MRVSCPHAAGSIEDQILQRSDTVVGEVTGHLSSNKDVIAMVRPGGAEDPLNPRDVSDDEAKQATVNTLAEECDIVASFWYPNPDDSWSIIDPIADTPADPDPTPQMLKYLSNNQPARPFWYAVDVARNAAADETSKPIIKWQVHRASLRGAKGIFFYAFHHATLDQRTWVKEICKQIGDLQVNNAFDTTSLTSRVQFITGNAVVYSFHKHCGDYWLLVADNDVANSANKTYVFKCDLGVDFDDFVRLREQYDDAENDVYVTDPGGTWKQFSGTLSQGGVKMYRFQM